MAPPDILVIGAGVIGCAVAHELARRGASVEVVDDRAPGMGATQASAGMLVPYIEASEGALLDLGVRGLKAWDDFLPLVLTDSRATLEYERAGSLSVARDDATLETLRATARALERWRVPAEALDGREVRRREPALSRDVRGGLFVSFHGHVDAHELTRALTVAARRHGARVLEPARVRRVQKAANEFAVVTDRGTLTADVVVMAAGSWSGSIEIEGSETLPVHPVRGQLLRLEWRSLPLARIVWGEGCYLVPWSDGTLLVGATVEEVGFDERNTVDGVRGLMDAATAIVPGVATAAFLGARAGLRPGTPDELPIIGPSPDVPNLFYATGHYRSGVLLAPLTAQLIGDAIVDGRIDPVLSVTSPGRFVSSTPDLNVGPTKVVSGFSRTSHAVRLKADTTRNREQP